MMFYISNQYTGYNIKSISLFYQFSRVNIKVNIKRYIHFYRIYLLFWQIFLKVIFNNEMHADEYYHFYIIFSCQLFLSSISTKHNTALNFYWGHKK